jgi:hypothetical protein
MSIAGDSGPSDVEQVFSSDLAGDFDEEVRPSSLRAGRTPTTSGPLFLLFVIACASGVWKHFECLDDRLQNFDDGRHLVGVVISEWKWFSREEAEAHPCSDFFNRACAMTRGGVFGYVGYVVVEAAQCEPTRCDWTCPVQVLSNLAYVEGVGRVAGKTVGELVARARRAGIGSMVNINMHPGICTHIFAGVLDLLHVVAVTRRVNRKLLLSGSPSSKILTRLIRSTGIGDNLRTVRQVVPLVAQRLFVLKQAVPADEVIDWLRASLDLKQIRKAGTAAGNFARIFARGGPESRHAMLARTRNVQYEVTRLARVRLDAVAMLAFRHFWKSLQLIDDMFICVWCDASPQWRGQELFAASFDLLAPGYERRRTFPFVAPEVGCDLVGKTVTLLWQIFLVVGPCFHSMRAFCNKVIGICTDMGVERNIAIAVDMLPDFFWFIGAGDYSAFAQTRLFPNAVQLNGWRHLWDTVLHRGLLVLRWFPSWLDGFKV